MSEPMESVEAFVERARAWLAENLGPRAEGGAEAFDEAYVERQRRLQRTLFDAGFAGISIPVRFGGQGLTPAHEAAFALEAQAFAMPDFQVLGITTFGACLPTLLQHAQEAFLAEHVPRILAGDELWCQFFSEPGAGSDLGAARTAATRVEGGWTLRGQKIWSSFAHLADWAMCLARTDPGKPKYAGLSWFALPVDAPRLTVRPIVLFTGDEDYCEEFLDGVFVPDTDVIGEIDRGWGVTKTLLVFERGAGQANIPQRDGRPGRLDRAMIAAAARTDRLPDRDTRAEVIDTFVNAYVYRQMRSMNARQAAAGTLSPAQASCAKLFRSDITRRRGLAMTRLLGARITAWDAGQDAVAQGVRDFLEAKKPAVAGGTEQMQRNAIGEGLLGLPRDPKPKSDAPVRQI
ncbi:acyl-CoA dehydrogenase family protein [Streptomyces sp. NPDC059766]|uniref:acyl-CoA dehydrogenase family protein n=1 Tax=Streptomyces sp. NPDC059766 TaxID=3346940 RepID=UPI003658EA2F